MRLLLCIFICLWTTAALAHKPSDSYLSITAKKNQLSGRWDIALRDLDFAIGLDSNDDGNITWGELSAKTMELSQYALARLTLGNATTACRKRFDKLLVDNHSDGNYAVLFFDSDCGTNSIEKLGVDYRLFADIDPQHRGLLKLNFEHSSTAAVLVPNQGVRQFALPSGQFSRSFLLDFIGEGVWHIWIGFDHILFLFSLLIPSVMFYQWAKWYPIPSFRQALWDVAKIVTAFTVAHSITLSMAVLGVFELPSRLVESVIAASVILAALNNLVPIFTEKRALLAFTFGLIHGFGFASVLGDLGLEESSKLWSLLGFNVGVEIGQMALVLLFLPIAFKFSRYPLYKVVMLKTCSAGIAALACFWFLERAFEISIFA